jgi:hypothetical protein
VFLLAPADLPPAPRCRHQVRFPVPGSMIRFGIFNSRRKGLNTIKHDESASSVPGLTTERSARRRITRRLLPFLWLLYVIAFLDRVKVAYAALEMSHDLGFSDRVFGLGAGIDSSRRLRLSQAILYIDPLPAVA